MVAFCVQFDPELYVLREILVRGRVSQALKAITKFQERSRMSALPVCELETNNFQNQQVRIEHT